MNVCTGESNRYAATTLGTYGLPATQLWHRRQINNQPQLPFQRAPVTMAHHPSNPLWLDWTTHENGTHAQFPPELARIRGLVVWSGHRLGLRIFPVKARTAAVRPP